MEKQSGQSSLGVEREYRMESGIQRDKKLDSEICLLSSSLRQFFDTILCTHRKVRNYKVRGIDNGITQVYLQTKMNPTHIMIPKILSPPFLFIHMLIFLLHLFPLNLSSDLLSIYLFNMYFLYERKYLFNMYYLLREGKFYIMMKFILFTDSPQYLK